MLEVRDLRVSFPVKGRRAAVVDGISFKVGHGEVLGIAGESGSGKSVTALSILRLIQSPGAVESGQILFEGRDLLQLAPDAMRRLRGKAIAMIFQEPMTSLNPVFSVGNQISESIMLHEGLTARQARGFAIDLLKRVGIPAAEERIDEYPHQLSGGMRQRVMIAMAVASRPKLLIADEPTTALDVTIQAQILELLDELRRDYKMALILITHDMGVIARAAERVMVMYAGRICEEGPVRAVFHSPAHPYSVGLLRSIPRLNNAGERLEAIPGMVPSPSAMRRGCAFAPRCERAQGICSDTEPALAPIGSDHEAACLILTGHREGRGDKAGGLSASTPTA